MDQMLLFTSSRYEFLKRSEDFKKITEVALNCGIRKGFLAERVNQHLVKTCQENKELMKVLTKTATKSIVRHHEFVFGIKTVVKHGMAKVGSQAIKRGLNIANPAGIAVDVTQAGLEYFGYEREGRAVGKWGNIVTGIWAGFVIGGPVGAVVGAWGGFGIWVVGEAVGHKIDEDATL